jgi:hypothetical protein
MVDGGVEVFIRKLKRWSYGWVRACIPSTSQQKGTYRCTRESTNQSPSQSPVYGEPIRWKHTSNQEARTSLTVECESSSLPLIGRVPHRSVCDIYLISSTDRRRCFATGGRLQLKHNRTSLRQHESVDHE